MILIRKDLCRGCGLCTHACPRGAIRIRFGKAEVDHTRCDECLACVNSCPFGTIIQTPTDTLHKMAILLNDLRRQMEEMESRLDYLETSRAGR